MSKLNILKGVFYFIMKDVMLLVGAGQIGMAIARRVGYGKKIIIGDKNIENAKKISDIMNNAGFDTIPF